MKAEQWEQARELYTDMGYLEKKCQEAGVLSVEEALKGAAVEAPGKERELARELHRAIQACSHVLRQEAKALPLHVYNWLRCGGWERERLEKELRFPAGLTGLRLRHPVRAGGNERTLEGHGAWVTGCAVTPDGRRVVSASWDEMLKVWELETGREVATLWGHRDIVAGCAVTPDGRRVVSASGDKTLKVWELETGREVATLKGHRDRVTGCAVTPDGRRVVSASQDGTLKVWELETGREVATLWGHRDIVAGCAVTPDGRRVVSASQDKTLKVWELETGREGATLKGHGDVVIGCAVTPDGRHVVSASQDKTLKVWDLNSGQCLHTLYGFNAFISVAAGPDVICAGDVTGNVWILETGSSIARTSVDRTRETSPITPMNFTFPPPLLEAYRSQKLALCIGSGLSLSKGVQGNFPTWTQLPQRLLDACERQGVLDAESIQARRALLTKRMRLDVMLSELGTLSTYLGRGYPNALNDIFRPADAAPGLVHNAIA